MSISVLHCMSGYVTCCFAVKFKLCYVQVSPLNATMMAVIMCMHSILEGAALGSQQEVSKALNIFVPTIAHKVCCQHEEHDMEALHFENVW